MASMGRRTAFAAIATLLGCVIITLAPGAVARPVKTKHHAPPARPAPVTFGIGAANATGIDGRSDLDYQSSPGGQLLDHIAVVNYASTRQRLTVYAVDATNAADGTVAFADAGTPRTGAAAWFTVHLSGSTDAITLGPHATRILPISMIVPKNASPGDHLAGIVASLTSRARSGKGEKVNLEQRVALRAYIRISGPVLPGLRIENLRINYHNAVTLGSATVSFAVHNTGNVSLGGTVQVQMGGVVGPTASAKGTEIPLLLPGGTFAEKIQLHGVWPVFYDQASVKIHPLAQAGAVDPVLPNFSSSSHVVTIPWLVIGLVVLVVALVLVRQFVWRPYRARVVPARHQLAGSRA
jgi:hypothetical protein